jgi:SAM-dependent methyltransferase
MTFFESEENALYARPDWWEGEYQKCNKEDSYEWYTSPSDRAFVHTLLSLIPKTTRGIINFGCGISRLQNALFDAGFHGITNVDISPTCIDLMKGSDTRGMKWEICNMLEPFPYASDSFDLALDKASLDAIILDGADHWEIEEDVYQTAATYFREVSRVLTPGGVFLQISFGQPHFRRRLFEREEFHWTVNVHTLQPTHSFHFFVYECRKGF